MCRADGVDFRIENALQLTGRCTLKAGGYGIARLLGDAQPLVDDDAADLQRIVERLLELDVEPVIDRRVEEAQREPVHDDHRRHRQQNEHDQQSPAEARTGRAALEIHAQTPQALRDRECEERESGRRRAENPAVVQAHTAAAGGIFGELERCKQQHQRSQRRKRATQREFQPAAGCHVYSVAESCQAGSNSAGRRNAPGSAAVSRPAWTRADASRGSVANAAGKGRRSELSPARR